MGLYNFQKRFAPFVLDGSKTHTIRAKRKHPDKVGSDFHAYTGLRSEHRRLLLRSSVVKIEDITIHGPISGRFEVFVDGIQLSADELDALAWRDGFRDRGKEKAFASMMEFWEGRLPFRGDIIHWKFPPTVIGVSK